MVSNKETYARLSYVYVCVHLCVCIRVSMCICVCVYLRESKAVEMVALSVWTSVVVMAVSSAEMSVASLKK
jgi:hypothetical protein